MSGMAPGFSLPNLVIYRTNDFAADYRRLIGKGGHLYIMYCLLRTDFVALIAIRGASPAGRRL